MKIIFLLIGVLCTSGSVHAKSSLMNSANKLKRNTSTEYNYFAEANKDIAVVLANPVFKDYTVYTIDNIRHGEIGGS